MIIKGKLLTFKKDLEGYITYVFENLNSNNYLDKYIMCTQFPNWDIQQININDIGFVEFEEHFAGTDKWFDGNKFIPYKYNTVQITKFILDKPQLSDKIIIL